MSSAVDQVPSGHKDSGSPLFEFICNLEYPPTLSPQYSHYSKTSMAEIFLITLFSDFRKNKNGILFHNLNFFSLSKFFFSKWVFFSILLIVLHYFIFTPLYSLEK